MKRVLITALVLSLALSTVGCGSKATTPETETTAEQTVSEQSAPEAEAASHKQKKEWPVQFKEWGIPTLASATVSGASLPEKVYPAGTFVYNGLDFGSVFNPEYYYNHYPDLQKAIGYDPQKLFRHFIQYGFAEGRTAIG